MLIPTALIALLQVVTETVLPAGGRGEKEWPSLTHSLSGWSYGLAFSPDSKTLAAGGRDGGIRAERNVVIWNVASGTPVVTLKGHRNVMAIAYGPDGKVLAGGGDGLRVWEVATGKTNTSIKGHAGLVRAIAFSPSGKLLASGAGWDSKFGNTVGLWGAGTLKSADKVPKSTGNISTVAFSPDGKTLAFAGMGGVICLWGVDDGRERAVIDPGGKPLIHSIAFSPDGKTLALALEYLGSKKALAPDGVPDAPAWDQREIVLWDITTGKLAGMLAGHDRALLSVAFSPDGRMLASASRDRTVKLWDVGTRKSVASLQMTHLVEHVAFSPDGQVLAVASRGANTIQLWSLVRSK